MRAVWYESPGKARDVLHYGALPDPEPGAGEVRVRLAVSGVNPTDYKRRRSGSELKHFPRVVPHHDGAGVIDRAGPGVPTARVGERVWLYAAQVRRAFGTAAEYIALPSRQAIRLPDGASLDDGACIGVPTVTAHRCLFADGPIAGKTVLVTGGAGRVARYAVQLAKRAGATVIATVGRDDKAALVRGFGADHVLNYKAEDIAMAVKRITGAAGVDRIVDVAFGANIQTSIRILKISGVIATYASEAAPEPTLPFYPLMYNDITVRFVDCFEITETVQDQAFTDVTAALADGALKHQIGARFPLAETAAAHEALESGQVFGSVLVDVGP